MKTPRRIVDTALAITRAIGSPASIVIHTMLFIGAFTLVFADIVSFDRMLLILTTIVSLEAIYLSLFIQMTINFTTESLEEVEQDIDEIQKDVDEIQSDVDEIQENVDELQEDVEDIAEDEQKGKAETVDAEKVSLEDIKNDLKKLIDDVERKIHLK